MSFTVNTGRIGILLGPNGAGKSTVIKSIAGLLKYEGGVGIDGLPRLTMAEAVQKYVGIDFMAISDDAEAVAAARGKSHTR